MSPREVRTTDPGKSIWLDLPEDDFRGHLVMLEERTNAVPIAPHIFNPADWLPPPEEPKPGRQQHTLPLAVEQQLADEFASLVAVEEGAQSVAAVCIEEHVHSQVPGLTLRFAAMDVSLNDAIKNSLQEWSDILSKAAVDVGTNSEHVDALFHGVVRLHFRRLLARLRSGKWEKPEYLSRSHKKPLWQDIGVVIHRAQFVYTKKEKVLRAEVEKLSGELAAVYKAFELASAGDELCKMEQLVQASFELWSPASIKDYLVRLESSVGRTPTAQIASALKSFRQIQKIGSYRRICVSLVNISRTYPSLFTNGIKLAYSTPYQSVPTTIGYEEWATSCHVHAEVQLAVHYDLMSSQNQESFLRPRAIGISKSLCYLCYQFLLAHQGFFPSRTHGRLYDQWTIPDLVEFNDAVVKRYRTIVKDIDDEVRRFTESEPELWRMEPMTSVDVYCTSHGT